MEFLFKFIDRFLGEKDNYTSEQREILAKDKSLEAIMKITGLADMSLASRYALRSYLFNFSNRLPEVESQKETNRVKEYIFKLVGIAALKGAKNLYIRSGHFHYEVFDHLADVLDKVENEKNSILENFDIKITLIDCPLDDKKIKSLINCKVLSEEDQNLLKDNKVSTKFIAFLRKNKDKISYLAIQKKEDLREKDTRFIGFFDNQNACRAMRSWKTEDSSSTDTGHEIDCEALINFHTTITKEECERAVLAKRKTSQIIIGSSDTQKTNQETNHQYKVTA